MDQMVIEAVSRKETGKKVSKQLRAEGKIPAVAYNENGESVMLTVVEKEFSKVWRSITKATLVNLKIDGKDNMAFIKDVEYDIITDKILHADLHLVSGNKPVTFRYKIQTVGKPAGVLKGGFMVPHVTDIKVKALPQDLPATISADVSKLEIGEKFSIKDLALSDKITILSNVNDVVVSIAPPKRK